MKGIELFRLFIDNVQEDKEHQVASQAKKMYRKVIAKHPKNQISHEIGIGKLSVYRIFRSCKWKSFIPTMVQAINEDDTDRRKQFSEWCTYIFGGHPVYT